MPRPNKIDWIVYRFFRWWWNPILQKRPDKAWAMGSLMKMWVERYASEQPEGPFDGLEGQGLDKPLR